MQLRAEREQWDLRLRPFTETTGTRLIWQASDGPADDE